MFLITLIFYVIYVDAAKCQIDEAPLDVTAKIGGNVTLRCGVSDPTKYTEWMEFITETTGNVIFASDIGVFGTVYP